MGIHKRLSFVFAALIFVVTACAPPPPPPLAPVSQIRNPAVRMSATSRFNPDKFSGHWVRRGGYSGLWELQDFDFTAPRAGQAGYWRETANGIGREANVSLDVLGVFNLNYRGAGVGYRQLAVLWVDEGFRTAVLATRDGRFAIIVDRNPTGGEDRITAAKSVLEHNGFDLSQLRMTGR